MAGFDALGLDVSEVMAMRDVLAAYLDAMATEQIPLSEPVMVACVLADLCRIAGLPVPDAIERALAVIQRRELALRVVAGGLTG